MSALEIVLAVAFVLWLMVCSLTAVSKGRGLGWGVAAAMFPPLFLALLFLRPVASKKSERVRCPLCRMGWVTLDRLPRVCSGCGEEVPYHVIQKEMHKDMM